MMASAMRLSTRAVSAMVSPRPSWLVAPSRISDVPPNWRIAMSNDTRVRVEFFSKIDRKEHTSELQSLMRISYAVFCLKKKKRHTTTHDISDQIRPIKISHTHTYTTNSNTDK